MRGESARVERTNSPAQASMNRFQTESVHVGFRASVAESEQMSVEEGIVFRSLVQAMPLAMFVCMHGRIQYANPAGDAMLGVQEIEDVINHDFLQFVHQRDSETVRGLLSGPQRDTIWKSICMVQRNGNELLAEMMASDLGEGCVQLIARKNS